MSSETIYRIDEKEAETSHASTPVRIRRQSLTIIIAFVTASLMCFTIFFAYNSSLANPMLSLFVSKSPERSILILNVASHLTLFALAELISSVCDTVRWVLASHGSGTTALTFLTLSRATGFIGSLYLSLGGCHISGADFTHRVWGVQRYLRC
jgi:hypothetical protein